MDENISYSTSAQKEALINELKGNLFEYLVGRRIAAQIDREHQYITSLPSSFESQLKDYERWLLRNDRELVGRLPLLADSTFHSLKESISNLKYDDVFLVGKISGGSHNNVWHEADLLLRHSRGGEEYPISLKLCKANSFVNTKSAGIFSFVEKYFTSFSDHHRDQEELSSLARQSFWQMGHKLHSLAGLEFSGKFGLDWEEAGYDHLPGHLNEEMHQVLIDYYHQVISLIYQQLKRYWQSDRELFIRSILPLMGMGQKNMIQAYCFHGDEIKNGITKRYLQKSIMVIDYDSVTESLTKVEFGELRSGLSSFEIDLLGATLQIRVKPMNRFTTPGLKINCSLKHR